MTDYFNDTQKAIEHYTKASYYFVVQKEVSYDGFVDITASTIKEIDYVIRRLGSEPYTKNA